MSLGPSTIRERFRMVTFDANDKKGVVEVFVRESMSSAVSQVVMKLVFR